MHCMGASGLSTCILDTSVLRPDVCTVYEDHVHWALSAKPGTCTVHENLLGHVLLHESSKEWCKYAN